MAIASIIQTLVAHDVEFIVMGGMAAVLQGEDLLPDSDWLEVDGARFRVLSLARLIVVKEQLNRAKDQAMLVLLRATLEELQESRP